MLDTLIIRAELSNPPSEALAFRTLTLLASSSLHLHSIVEVENSDKDLYWRYLKAKSCMDFIEQLITPIENESGIRIDTGFHYPLTIAIDRITFQNLLVLIGQLSTLVKLV